MPAVRPQVRPDPQQGAIAPPPFAHPLIMVDARPEPRADFRTATATPEPFHAPRLRQRRDRCTPHGYRNDGAAAAAVRKRDKIADRMRMRRYLRCVPGVGDGGSGLGAVGERVGAGGGERTDPHLDGTTVGALECDRRVTARAPSARARRGRQGRGRRTHRPSVFRARAGGSRARTAAVPPAPRRRRSRPRPLPL